MMAKRTKGPMEGGTAPELKEIGPFQPEACHFLEELYRRRDEWRAKRSDAFKSRDGVLAEIQDLGKRDKTKRRELEADYGELVMEIDRLNKSIKWAESETFDTIKNARQATFWESKKAATPPPSLFEIKSKKDAAKVGGDDGKGNVEEDKDD